MKVSPMATSLVKPGIPVISKMFTLVMRFQWALWDYTW